MKECQLLFPNLFMVFVFDISLCFILSNSFPSDLSLSSEATSPIDPLAFTMGCQRHVITLQSDQ